MNVVRAVLQTAFCAYRHKRYAGELRSPAAPLHTLREMLSSRADNTSRRVSLTPIQQGAYTMAIYHLSIKIVSRGKGKSAVAAAAYRSGEKIKNEYDGIIHDYTRKRGVVHTEILLPVNAPAEYADRAVLWNAVEQVEKAKNSQLAREIELALPVELSREQGITLVRDYVKQCFAEHGMCADIYIHDTGNGNPHAHILLTMRPFNEDRSWGDKQKKEYILNKDGEKVYDKIKRQYKCTKVQTTDWNEQDRAEIWRSAWAESVNRYLERNNLAGRIDHRSYERQGVEQIPTIHLGVAASQMEKRGIRTERGNINRDIEISNQRLRQLKARIVKLQSWLKEEMSSPERSTLADYIQDILYRKAQDGKSQLSQKLYNLKDAANMINFLTTNKIMDMAGLDEHFGNMIGKQMDIRDKLKPIERRLKVLDKHIGQADTYRKYKSVYTQYQQEKNPKKQAAFAEKHRTEITLYEAADSYLKGVMNGKTGIPLKSWKAERAKLTAERSRLDQDYVSLKAEVKDAEQIRRSVHSIMRQEQRERQPQRARGIDR